MDQKSSKKLILNCLAEDNFLLVCVGQLVLCLFNFKVMKEMK